MGAAPNSPALLGVPAAVSDADGNPGTESGHELVAPLPKMLDGGPELNSRAWYCWNPSANRIPAGSVSVSLAAATSG